MTLHARLLTLLALTNAVAFACDANQSSDDDGGPSTLSTSADEDGETGEETGGETGGSEESGPGPGTEGEDTADTGSADTGADIEIDPENLVDDLEDGDAVIYARNGRQGAWYTYNDATMGAVQTPEAMTSFTPAEGGAPTSPLFMAHTDGAGFSEWGFGVGVDLNNEGDDMGGPGIRMAYDASAHAGLVFRARGDVSIRLKILVEAIVPTDGGGTCTEMCEDAHGKIVPLTGDWVQYVVPFDDLFQEGWGFGEVALDPATLMSIQFQVAKSTDGMVEIDDIGFY